MWGQKLLRTMSVLNEACSSTKMRLVLKQFWLARLLLENLKKLHLINRKILSMGPKIITRIVLAASLLVACVQQKNLDAWVGQPASKLEAHPVFSTMNLEVRNLSDGSQMLNYVNGKQVSQCFGGATSNRYGQSVVVVQGNQFCSTSFAACNNQFLVRDGIIQWYRPVGSGGARCMTNDSLNPI